MYFKNKTTGITWHITDKAHIKRLESDKGYEKVSDNKPTKKETKQPENTDTVEYEAMEWQELRSLASNKGININGKKRKQIEQELHKLGDSNATE